MVPVAAENPAPPRQVGVYRLEEKIGSGAMGTVYRATHTTLHKEVALKLVHAEDPEGEMCQRFLLEGVAASRVRHPNAVEVLDAGIIGTNAYLAMQLLEGETLSACLRRQGRLPATYAVDMFLPLCAALMTAHGAGVLHRDIKPANIFLSEVGRGEPEPMLLDFGISKILGPVDAELTQNPRFLGTPLYIAPEQADGASGSPLSDQYSLALSLYETILGVRPFEKHKDSLMKLLRHVAEGGIRPASDLDASISFELSDVLARAMATDPKERFPSLKEFGAGLLPFASEARRTLWQHSFVDAERTMASASSPVSSSPAARRVSVSVERSPSQHPREHSTLDGSEEEEGEEFISHSKLFGDATESTSSAFDAARSSISRRGAISTGAPTRRNAGDSIISDSLALRGRERLFDSDTPIGHRDRNSVGVFRPSPASTRTRRGNRLVWGLSLLLALFALAAMGFVVWHDVTHGQQRVEVRMQIFPTEAQVELDGKLIGSGHFEATFPVDGQLHQLRISHPGYEPMTVIFKDSPPPREVRLVRAMKPEPATTPKPPEQREASPSEPEVSAASPEASPDPSTAPTTTTRPRPSRRETTSAPAAVAVPRPARPQSPSASASRTSNPEVTEQAPSPAADEGKSDTAAPEDDGKQRPIVTGNLDPWAE